MPSVIPQGLFAPKADGIGIVDDFSNTPTAKILWRFLNLTHGTKGATKMKRLLTAGIFGTILGIVGTGTANASIVSSGFLDEKLTEYALSTSLDLKANQKDLTALNDIVGKENWDIVLNLKNKDFPHLSELFPNLAPDKGMPIPDISNYIYDNLKLIDTPNLAGVTDKFLHGWTNSDGETYLGLKDINTKIGTLPRGNFPEFPGYEHLSYIGQPLTYPTSLAELITALYGNLETDSRGLLSGIITGFPLNGNPDESVGLMPNFDLARTAIDIARANATKIGTVPDGKNLAGMISETDAKIGVLPPDTTVTGMMGNPVLLNNEQTIIPLYDLILLGSKGQLVVNPINGITMPLPLPGLFDIADAVKKIGDLPTEYATVGAALTAIKGIAEDAKAAALAAIPDPKQEGSSGKFVLTVDIVGDNATYHWEKIDREGETTTTTE